MVTTSTEITVYDRVDNPVVLMESLGKSMYESGMFGCSNEAQGRVLALACIAENKNPIELARVYHIIDKRLSMRADAMLAEFRKLGGKVIWTATGDDGIAAKAKFTFEGVETEIGFTIDDAKRAKLIRAGGNWEKDPGAMLRARTTSKAIRMLCPEIVAGYYTPEEIEDMNGDGDKKAPVAVDAEALAKTVAAKGRKGKKEAAEEKPVVDDVIDAEFVAKPEEHFLPIQSATVPVPAEAPCSAADSEAIKNLFATLGMTHEQQTKALAKRNAQAVRNLTAAQAAELLAALEAKAVAAAKVVETTPATTTTTTTPAATTNISAAVADTDPCSPDQVTAIKNLLSVADKELVLKVKSKLNAANLTLAQLCWRDANKLEQGLRMRAMEVFFAADLEAAAAEAAPFDVGEQAGGDEKSSDAAAKVATEADPAKN